ncbi:MAG: helix-turn-helix domain-containing protein [Alphaproteobacteria bacterium]|nr:helix-turn-helix domain-containing protein [Alphaproteobacteria bacterium]
MNDNDLLTPNEAAAYTRYSTRTIARWRAIGMLEPLGCHRRPRYRRQDVDAVLEHLAVAGERSCPPTHGADIRLRSRR